MIKIGTNVYFDIETIPLPESERMHGKPNEDTVSYGNTKDPVKRLVILKNAADNWEGKCALSAHLGQIALICVAIDDEEPYALDYEHGEEGVLEAFSELVSHYNPFHSDRLIGHNIMNFDVPFIWRRAMVRGVDPGDTFTAEMYLSPYKRKFFIDTMTVWGAGERGASISLVNLCGAFGISAKTSDIKGADFYKHWKTGKEKCVEYCIDDVRSTRAVAQRMGY